MTTGLQVLGESRAPGVFVFNPFAEGYIACGHAFTPVRHQARLAEDLGNLPQFLCDPDDIVLLGKRPSVPFLEGLARAGFPLPEFVELSKGRIDPAGSLGQRRFGKLRPWAWGPDTVKLLEPLFARLTGGAGDTSRYFNDDIAKLYSKAWSADFLRKVMAYGRAEHRVSPAGFSPLASRLCSEREVGVAADTLEGVIEAVAAIRGQGHHRVVVKEAYGLAGHNAIRLWEPDILPAQRRWLAHALSHGCPLVVEPWLERELDFSVQLEMGPRGLELCGFTGLMNDRKGQFLANWAEPDYGRCLPAKVNAFFEAPSDVEDLFQRVYKEIISLLESELQQVGFSGPVSIDAFIYRTAQGDCRLKPVVEINPRYTMGRLTLELMKHTVPGSYGLFRLLNRGQLRAERASDLLPYAASLSERFPLRLESNPVPRICQGALCLNDPRQAQVCLATFEVSRTLNLPGWVSDKPQHGCQ